MQKNPLHIIAVILMAITSVLVAPLSQAASITKAGSGTDLTDGASWSGSIAPTTSDVAVWDTGSLGTGLTLNSGAPSWLGITVNAGASDPINIASGGTLTLGTNGINMSASAINATFGCDLSLASGYQSWSVASGKTLALNGNLTRAAGASMSFPTVGVTSTTLANDSTGILGGWATVTGTSDWAANDGSGNITNYTGYTSVTGTLAPNAAQNWKNTATVTLSGSGTLNSMNIVGGDLAVGANTLTLGSGGLILGSSERWVSGTGGTIQSGLATGELYIHANTAAFTNGFQIQPKIINNLASTAVIKDGSGQVEMGNGTNTFSGGFYLNAGSVYLGASSTGSGGAPSQGPLGTGTVTINGGTLNVWGKNNGTTTTAGYTLANNIYIPAGASATINNGGQNGVLSGNISGVVPTFLGSGITGLFGANSYSGNTLITVGTLGVGNANGANNNLSSGDVIINTNGTLRVGYSVTSNTNRTYTANNIALAGGTLYAEDAWQYLTGNINVTSNSIVGSTYNNAGGEQDKGLFLGGALSGSAALTVQHSRINTANSSYITSFVAITNNANTYSGTITINENTSGSQGGVYLGVNGSTALANATINVPGPVAGSGVKFGNSPLVFSAGLGGSATLGALVGSGPVVLSGYNEVSHAYVGNIALTVGGNNATTNFAGVLSGGGSLIKAGSGTYTLTGTNTYTGSTTVSAGTLTIGGAGLLGGGNYSGAIINNASLNYDSSAAQTLSGPISGSGTLTVLGTRTLTLGGFQSSSPNAVTINDGATLNETFSSAAQLAPTSLTVGNTTGASLGFVLNSTSVARIAAGTLTLNGTTTINILGGNLVAGSSYPLIAYTTLSGAGSYTLGTVPGGVAGNLSISANTIYFNVTGVTNSIWTGVVNGTWDINTTANWTNTGTLGNTYIDGSMIQFDDTGINTTTISNAVATTLKPGNVLVTNNTLNYNFKTNTIIAGIGGLTKTGTANLTNSTPNTYTGPTTINQGQVVVGVASVANVSGALGNNSAVTLANDATAALNLNNFATQVGSLSGGGSVGGNVALGSATLTAGADNSSTTYAGAIAGTGGLTKIGTGTLTLSGTNVYSGNTLIAQGKVVLNGNGTLGSPTAGFIRVGNTTGQAGAMYQSGVNTVVSNSTAGLFGIATAAGAYGYYNLASGTINTLIEIDPANGGAGDFGQFDMTGGTVNISSNNPYFLPCRNGAGESSVVNISGGTLQIAGGATPADSAFNGLAINWGNTGAANTNTTTISGSGQLLFPSLRTKLNEGSSFNGTSGNSANVCALNLNGGLFQTLGFLNGGANNPNVNVNFNGGTLKAGTAANASYMSGLGGLYLYGNGGTFDNNGLAITIGQAWLSPTGNGVASIGVGTAGSGYIVPPRVTIVGDGTGATAYSTVDPVSGAVTGIIVTCPGTGYSTASASLAGGGGSGATAGTVTLAANTSGAMTFTGAGTTTLNGAYYNTGGLKVLGGTLVMNTANGVPSPAGDLVVSNGSLTLNASGGSPLPANNVSIGSTLNLTLNPSANGINAVGNVTLGANSTLNLTYGTVTANPSASAIYSSSGSFSRSGTTTINISSTGLGMGMIPLITVPGLNTTNGFAIGSLPAGVNGVLTNSTSGELDLLITSAGQLLLWRGTYDGVTALTNWDIGTSTNWVDSINNPAAYHQYSGNTIGDNVIFADGAYNTDGTNRVNLPTKVVPATVEFYTSAPYILAGAGGIGGATSVVLTNVNNTIYLLTSNSYTGGTIIGSGVLAITNDNALGTNTSGITLGGGTLQLDAPLTNSRAVTVTANSTIGVVTNATVQLSGTFSGSGGLTKTDNGTLTLAGTNSYSGSTVVRNGILSVPASASISNAVGGFAVGSIAGVNAILSVSGGAVSDSTTTGNAWASYLQVGNGGGINGAINLSAGVLNAQRHLILGNAGGYGAMTMSSGSLTVGSYFISGFGASGLGVFNQTGGDVTQSQASGAGATLLGSGNGAIGVMSLSGGTFTATAGGIYLPENGSSTGILNISGTGAVTAGNVGVKFGNSASAISGTLNLLGGTLTANVLQNGGASSSAVNFNGGTLKASGNNASFMTGLTAANVYSGGAIIDDGGYAITIAQPLLAPAGYGVSSISLSDGGSGYIAPPVVVITGGSGSNATAVATVSGGSVTAVSITSPGVGYSAGDSLSVSFAGGGATVVAPSVSAVNLAPNASGGLVKRGAGTLTLSGANTYSGLTLVTNGTLLLSPSYQAGGAVTVADGKAFGVSAASVSNSATIGALTLGSAGPTTLNFSYGFSGNPTNAALTAGAVTINGSSTIAIGGNFALGAFPVLKYTSLSGTFNSAVTAPRGMVATVSNDVPDKTIYVVVSSLSSPIVWTGTNPLPGKTNLWDLNTTTNWLISGSPTTYQETLPPGDAVVFNDSGSGTVLLSNTASPAGITISNSSVNYTFQGTGHVSGGTGLTKTGTGTVTLNLTNNDYTGSTIISNGTLIAIGGSAIGDSSAVTLADAAGASLVISNNETIGSLAGGGSVGGNVSLPGALTAGGDNTSTTYAGALSGSGSLTKVGTGTMALGGSNSVSGNVWVNTGALGVTGNGSMTTPRMFVAASSGTTGTVNISGTSTLTNNYDAGGWWVNYALGLGVDDGHEGTLNMSGGTVNETGRVWVGNWGGTGHWNQTGGTANISEWIFVGGMQDNNTAQPNGSIGTAIVSNATLSAGNVVVGCGGASDGANPTAVATSRVKGDMTVANGGVVNSEGDLQVGRSGEGSTGWGSYGTLNIENGGIVNVASTVTRWMTVGRYNSIDATVNIKSGGTLNLNAGTSLMINEGNNTGVRVVNVSGLLQGTAAGGSTIDMNRNATAGGTTTLNITNGGVVAVDSIIGKANCTLNFDNGTLKATASNANFIGSGFTANILPGGAILDTAGYNPTVVGNLLNNGINGDGGLTKIGNGTLLLNGVNTYTNTTTVNGGLLGGSGTIAGPLVVNNGGGVSPGNGIGTLTVNGNITLNAGSTNIFDVNGSTLAHDTIVAGGNVTYGGVLNIVTNGTFTNGQTFTLFSGAGAASASNFSSIQTTPASSIVFSFTNGILTVVSAGAPSQPVITSIGISGSTLTISGTNGTSGQQFRVLSSTNLALSMTNWTPIYTNTFTGDPFSLSLPVTLSDPQQFYRISIP